MRLASITAVVTLSLAAAGSAFAQADAQLARDVDAFINQAMALNATPGLAIAVVKGSEPVLVKGYGFADVERKRPVTATTGFYIASITKTFTALTMKLMEQRGQLRLGDPVSKYLPQLVLAPGLSADSITLTQLLTHTHGIANSGPIVALTAFNGVHTNARLLELMREHKPSEVGRSFRYTNVGFNLAGLVIDEVTRDSWKNVMQKVVLDPLGMKNTRAFISRFDSAQLAMPYAATGDGGFQRIHYAKGDGNMHAAGGLISTAQDMAKWLEVQMNGGMLDGKRIFPETVIAATQSRIVTLPASERPDAQTGQGLGWQLYRFNGEDVIMHGGGFAGFISFVAFVPASKVGVAVMVNDSKVAGSAADLIAEYVIERALNKPGYQDKYAQRVEELRSTVMKRRDAIAQDAARRAARPQTLPHPLSAYAGVYENPIIGRFVWQQQGDKLHARWGLLQSTAEVFNHEKNQLRVELEPGRGEVVEFRFTDGRATSMVYDGREYVRHTQ
jgi:CubicO group peptidase (beta-lactamase class C family)